MGRLSGGCGVIALIGGGWLQAAAYAETTDATSARPLPSVEVVEPPVVPISAAIDETRSLPAVSEVSQHFARVARLVTPSLVHIQSHRTAHNGGAIDETGSGVLMRSSESDEVFAVTNEHVVSGAQLGDIEIQLNDGRVIHPYEVLVDVETDVAVLKVRAGGLQHASWGDSNALEIGHMVLAMGSPFGLSKSITFGIISAKGRRALDLGSGREVLNQDFLQTDAAINPGNSGGPLIDMHGRVVGINTAIASSSGGNEGIGFSIPSNLVQRVVRQLLTNGHVQRAYLGVRLDEDFTAEKARQYSLDRSRGARVVLVLPQSPAAKAGLRPNDIILSFDGREIEDESHLIHLVSLTEVNRLVSLQILREGHRLSVQVQLTDRAGLDGQSALPPEHRFDAPESEVQNVGLTLQRVDERLAPQLGLGASSEGLLVMDLRSQPADPEELRLYDVILEAARTPVVSVEQFADVLTRHAGHRPVLLKVRRLEHGVPRERLLLWQPPAPR
jgi:serine protease Do